MGILKDMWGELWTREESVKQERYNAQVSDAVQKARYLKEELTPLQKVAEKQGAMPSLQEQSNALYKAMLMKSQLTQNAQLQQARQMIGQTVTSTNQAISNIYQPGTYGTTTSIFGGTTTAGIYPSQIPSPFGSPIRSLGSGKRDTLFLALKGIEEAAMAAPEGNHRYDDDAIRVLDMRNFGYLDNQEVSLLSLVSFCVANMYDVEPLLMLLEGYGITVVV